MLTIAANAAPSKLTEKRANKLPSKNTTGYRPIKIIKPNQLQWQHSAILPPDEQAIVLSGNPIKSGIFAIRVRLPKNYKGISHTHPP